MQYQERSKGKTQRLAAEAASPQTIERALLGMEAKLLGDAKPEDDQNVKGLTQGGDDESAEEAILRVALMNIKVDERQALMSSDLFKSLRASDDLLVATKRDCH